MRIIRTRALCASALCALLHANAFGQAHGRTNSALPALLDLDGVAAGYAKSVTISATTINLVMDLPLSKSVFNWVDSGRKADGTVTWLDAAGRRVRLLKFHEATVAQATLSTLDAASKNDAELTISLHAAQVKDSTLTDNQPTISVQGRQQKTLLASDFMISIDGLPTSHVTKVDAYPISPGSTTCSPLTITLPSADVPAFVAGQGVDRTGLLQLLESDMKTPVLTLEWTRLKQFVLKFDGAAAAGQQGAAHATATFGCAQVRIKQAGAGS